MLSKEEFIKYIKGGLKGYMPSYMMDSEVQVSRIVKRNETYTGLTFIGLGRVAPVINLDAAYARYATERIPMPRVMRELAADYMEGVVEIPEFEKAAYLPSMPFEEAKKLLFMHVCDGKNRDYLENKPYAVEGPYAATYHLELSHPDSNSRASVAVDDMLLERWGVSKEELHQAAIENMYRQAPPTLSSLFGVIQSIAAGDTDAVNYLETEKKLPEDDIGVFVLSNTQKLSGAAWIFDKDLADRIGSQMGGDYYILPASVHECLIAPADMMSPKEAAEMVRGVNRSGMIDKEIFFSDSVALYDRSKSAIVEPDYEPVKGKRQEQAMDKRHPLL